MFLRFRPKNGVSRGKEKAIVGMDSPRAMRFFRLPEFLGGPTLPAVVATVVASVVDSGVVVIVVVFVTGAVVVSGKPTALKCR